MKKGITVKELKERVLNTPEARKAYEEADKALAIIEALYEMREHAGLNKAQLAKRLHVTPSEINRMESNPLGISMKKLENYAEACGATLALTITYH